VLTPNTYSQHLRSTEFCVSLCQFFTFRSRHIWSMDRWRELAAAIQRGSHNVWKVWKLQQPTS